MSFTAEFIQTNVLLRAVSTVIQGVCLHLHLKKNDHIWADSKPR